MSTAVAINRTRDQSSHSFCCLKMNLQVKGMVRRMGGMEGGKRGRRSGLMWDPTHSLKLWKSLRMMMAM